MLARLSQAKVKSKPTTSTSRLIRRKSTEFRISSVSSQCKRHIAGSDRSSHAAVTNQDPATTTAMGQFVLNLAAAA